MTYMHTMYNIQKYYIRIIVFSFNFKLGYKFMSKLTAGKHYILFVITLQIMIKKKKTYLFSCHSETILTITKVLQKCKKKKKKRN